MTIAEKRVWDHTLEDKRESMMTELGLSVVDLLAPKPGERILDIGCGHRHLSKKIADMGIDLTVISYHEKTLAGASDLGLHAVKMRPDGITFDNEFDAAFTNSTLHLVRHLDRTVSGAWRALKSGGRFVGECGARGNIMTIISAAQKLMAKRGIEMGSLPHFYFPSQEEFQGYLEKQGFRIQSIEVKKAKLAMPCDMEEWLLMFANHLPKALDTADRHAFFKEVTDFCHPTLYDEKEGKWVLHLARLQFYAVKP